MIPIISLLTSPRRSTGDPWSDTKKISSAEGAYVDDILIRKCVGGGCGVALGASSADSPAQSPLLEKAAYSRRPSN